VRDDEEIVIPHVFLGQIWSEDEIVWGWTILITKSWGGGMTFQEENVLGCDVFKRKRVRGACFHFFSFFFFLLCAPSIQLSTILDLHILLYFMQYEHAFKWLYIEIVQEERFSLCNRLPCDLIDYCMRCSISSLM